jgi:hypothetical protein
MEASGSQVVDANGHMVSACFIEGASESEEADAHLIAAAPELLTALAKSREVVNDIIGIFTAWVGDACIRPELREAMQQIDAAIAKATGSAA